MFDNIHTSKQRAELLMQCSATFTTLPMAKTVDGQQGQAAVSSVAPLLIGVSGKCG